MLMNIQHTYLGIKDFKYQYCVTDILAKNKSNIIRSENFIEIDNWLFNNFGADGYKLRFEDYGQHGEWMLGLNREEDMVLFKLKWGYSR